MLWEKASTKIFRHLHGWLGLIICGLCASTGTAIGQFFDFGSFGAAVGGGIGGFIYSQVIVHFAVMNYRDILVDKHSLQKRNSDA